MIEQTGETTTAAAGDQAAAASADASRQSAEATTQSAADRPSWLPETLWDATAKAPKAEDLKKVFETDAARTKAEAERAALIPPTANDYKVELPGDFKMPDGWQIAPDDPMWKVGAEFAKSKGMTQAEFSQLAKTYVEGQMQATAKQVEARDAEFKKLGDNGATRVTAVHTFIDATAGSPERAAAVKASLINADAVAYVEALQSKLASAGITSFVRGGEVAGKRNDGKPDNWDSMTPLDRRTWDLQHPKAA